VLVEKVGEFDLRAPALVEVNAVIIVAVYPGDDPGDFVADMAFGKR